jgi:hypothetical protein
LKTITAKDLKPLTKTAERSEFDKRVKSLKDDLQKRDVVLAADSAGKKDFSVDLEKQIIYLRQDMHSVENAHLTALGLLADNLNVRLEFTIQLESKLSKTTESELLYWKSFLEEFLAKRTIKTCPPRMKNENESAYKGRMSARVLILEYLFAEEYRIPARYWSRNIPSGYLSNQGKEAQSVLNATLGAISGDRETNLRFRELFRKILRYVMIRDLDEFKKRVVASEFMISGQQLYSSMQRSREITTTKKERNRVVKETKVKLVVPTDPWSLTGIRKCERDAVKEVYSRLIQSLKKILDDYEYNRKHEDPYKFSDMFQYTEKQVRGVIDKNWSVKIMADKCLKCRRLWTQETRYPEQNKKLRELLENDALNSTIYQKDDIWGIWHLFPAKPMMFDLGDNYRCGISSGYIKNSWRDCEDYFPALAAFMKAWEMGGKATSSVDKNTK